MKETVASKIRAVQVAVLIIFIILIVLLSGCIGGKSVNANGTGRVITSSELIRQSNGIYKLKPVKLKSAKSKPVAPKLPEVKATHVTPAVSAVGKPVPFKPTVKEARLSPAEILIEDLKNVGKENNTNIDSSTTISKGSGWCGTKDPEIAGPCEAEPKVKVNWPNLIKFYLAVAIFLGFVYGGFRVARKKTENMINRERKTAKKRKAPKKRAAKKRK
jgi:hypothetical protein